MLRIKVVMDEMYDEGTAKFFPSETVVVDLEHSLVSMSKWESFWKEPFLGKKEQSHEQRISYIMFMILNENLPPEIFQKLIASHLDEIVKYVEDPHTATTLRTDSNGSPSREIVTSELIYYWMISLNVPVEFQHWHLSRLLTLIRVINFKNTPKKKMTMKERRELNKLRQKQLNTRG